MKNLLFLSSLLCVTVLGFSCEQKQSEAAAGSTAGIVAEETEIDGAGPKVQLVDSKTFQEQLDAESEPQLVDVRTGREYASGHLRGSNNIDIASPTFHELVSKLDTDRTVYVYCAVGGRSARAAEMLSNMGYEVVDLDGGIMAWQEAGFEIVR